jgi:hypothetical protein
MFTSNFLFKKLTWLFVIELPRKTPVKRSMTLELRKKDGLAMQMLQIAKPSESCPFLLLFRVVTVSTV